MKILIKNGRLIDPAQRIDAKLNLLTANGIVASITQDEPEADFVIDAFGDIVCPGFIDLMRMKILLRMEQSTVMKGEQILPVCSEWVLRPACVVIVGIISAILLIF